MINFKTVNYQEELLNTLKPVNKGISFKVGESVKAEVIEILPSGGVVVRAKGQLLEVQSEIPLQKGTQLLLKVLNLDENNRLILRILSLSKNGDKFKALENTNINSFEVSKLLDIFKNTSIKENIIQSWQFSGKILKEKIMNSGLFFEKKLLKKENLKDDLKFKMYKLLEDTSISNEDKKIVKNLINTITNYQIISKDFDLVFVFLPLILPDLKTSHFLYKKISQKSKEGHFLAISFEFKDIGKLVVSLFNIDKYLAMTFFSENKKFLDALKKNVSKLEKDLGKTFKTNFIFSNKIPNIKDFLKKENNFIDLKT